MTTLTMPLSMPLNILSFLDRLKDAGMSDTQVKAQAEVMQTLIQACEEGARKVSESTARETVNSMRAELREELATKGDLREESIAIRADVADVRGAIRETELRLQKEMQQMKYDLLKWQIAGWAALAAIMARGFKWF